MRHPTPEEEDKLLQRCTENLLRAIFDEPAP